MIRKYFIVIFISLTILVGFYLASAKKYQVEDGFPKILLEKGSDTDKSYFSIRTKRQKSGDLQIHFSAWSDNQLKPFLKVGHLNKIIKVNIFYELDSTEAQLNCKIPFQYILPKKEEDEIYRIVFIHKQDSLALFKNKLNHK